MECSGGSSNMEMFDVMPFISVIGRMNGNRFVPWFVTVHLQGIDYQLCRSENDNNRPFFFV